MMFKARLEKKIKKSIEETVSEYSTSLPKIVEHFFYGAIEIAPQPATAPSWTWSARSSPILSIRRNFLF